MAPPTAARVTRYSLPAYPTRLAVQADPQLLCEHVPPAWLGREEMAGLLGVFLAASVSGCDDRDARPQADNAIRSFPKPAAAQVAPLFVHGDGQGPARGALGCIAVAAPIFLSEDEALAVIRDTLHEFGVQMSDHGATLDTVVIHGRMIETKKDWITGKFEGKWVDVSGPLQLDIIDGAQRIGLEFITRDDFDRLGGNDEGSWTRDLKTVATAVGAQVRERGAGIYFGTFYDPVTYYSFGRMSASRGDDGEPQWEDSREAAQARSARQLRLQVKDFVDWLKAQGAI